MQAFDQHHDSKALIALANQDITTDTTVNGAIIDTAGFTGLEFLFASGTITDGAYAISLVHGDDSGLSDAADVPAAEELGVAAYVAADDDLPKRLGYIGKKRFVRTKHVSTGTTAGGTNFSAMALLTNAAHQPTSDQ